MKSKQFPGCCTARIVMDFGGTDTAEFTTTKISKARIVTYLKTRIRHSQGDECLIAITNSDQKIANAALTEMGFHSSPWMSKRRHAATKLRLWWKEP